MTAAELWAASSLSGTYETWSFGEAQEELAALVKAGVKKATSSAYLCFDVGERDGTGGSRQEISGSRQGTDETEPDGERLKENK